MVQIKINELQMIFQTSDFNISNCNIYQKTNKQTNRNSNLSSSMFPLLTYEFKILFLIPNKHFNYNLLKFKQIEQQQIGAL